MGNPNVGKSVVFSRLTGAQVISSNYQGTTVDFSKGKMRLNNETVEIIDAPGTYSLEASNRAEQVASDIMKEADVVICVIDATNLERNLYLCLELLEQNIPMVIALNLWDETKHLGIHIDEKKLVIPNQTHSAFVKRVNKPGIYEDTDGLYTDNMEVILSVQTADCLPVFLYEPERKIIAIVHAGWQGSKKGIILKTLEKLEIESETQTNKLRVAIGPGIQSSCFELREDVFSKYPAEFLYEHEDPEKKYLDLQSFVKSQFTSRGVIESNIFVDSSCTHCENLKYYSYRRDKNHSGRMMGIIGFTNALNK